MRPLFRYNAASAGLLMLMATCGTAAAQEFAGREKLRAHSAEFRQEVIKVTNGVWVGIGFSDANSVLIEGEGGSIVVDTTSDVEDAKAVKPEFAKVSTALVRAIIYTHSPRRRKRRGEAAESGALSELGERQISAIARNYYLSAAQYLLRDLPAR